MSSAVRLARGLGALVLAGTATGLAAAPAHAEEYRYWSFWTADAAAHGGGGWTYATEGPSTARPADGAVAGFRFTVSADSARAAKPRAAADFDAVCGGTKAADGRKRVAVVLDFGTAADAPKGETPPAARTECVRVPEDASAGDALAAVAAPLRYDSSALLCAISGYPETGCAEQAGGSSGGASDRSPGSGGSAAPEGGASGSGAGGPSAGLIGGIAAVAVLGAAAVWQARRRRG
ncbi:SCO2322 family protein [Streptomyces sp. NPDC053542]|uniref:SCO2322 family protein n=1 Tax=Streptomyces sp. NPDC053542 TaxID=3365710 RepID=UPI0037D8D941